MNSWLNFKDDDDFSEMGRAKKKEQKPKNILKDKEGVDFGYYFTYKY